MYGGLLIYFSSKQAIFLVPTIPAILHVRTRVDWVCVVSVWVNEELQIILSIVWNEEAIVTKGVGYFILVLPFLFRKACQKKKENGSSGVGQGFFWYFGI